jgi:succinoglycan biosynthesis transport protein ExoP
MPADAPRSPTPASLDLRSYLEVLLRRKRVIAVVTLVSVILALAMSVSQSKVYVAEADVLMNTSTTDQLTASASEIYSQSINVTRRLTNEIQQFKSGVTRDAVNDAYDGPLDPKKVTASTDGLSDVITVSLSATDPKEAATLVNLYIDVFVKQQRTQRVDDILSTGNEIQAQVDDLSGRIATIRQPLTEVETQLNANPGDTTLQARRDDLTAQLQVQLAPLELQRSSYQQQLEQLRLSANISQTSGARLLTKADVPDTPVSPKPVQNAIIAIFVGLLLGVVLAFLRDTLDERILGMDDLARAAPDLKPMAVLPEARIPDEPGYLSVREDPRSPIAEAFRSLRTSVKFAGLDHPIRVVQITSALPGEGKTTVVANLAESLARGGDRVAVVCCDLRRPRLHRAFRQQLSPGLTDVILHDASLDEALTRINDNLYCLSAGTAPPNPSELLSSSRAAAVIQAIAAEFDVVLIDCTPVLPVTDALVVSRFVDATLVVVDIRSTKRRALQESITRLGQVSAPVAGLVLNGVGPTDAYQYGYGYGYAAYGASDEDPTPPPPTPPPAPFGTLERLGSS